MKTLLLVEDEVILALSEKTKLEKYDYSVWTVNSGEKAIEFVTSNPGIDLVLMDINLGSGIDGTQAAESILRVRDIPIVFVSSHTNPEIVEKTEKITSYGYVVKNSSITVLDASIKMAFKLFDEKRSKAEKEEALRVNEDRLSKIMIAANDGMWDWNLKTDQVYFDPRYYQMSGYEVDEFPHSLDEFLHHVHPDDREFVMGEAHKHLSGEIDRFDVEFRFRKKSGAWQWIQGKGIIVERDEQGHPLKFVGTHRDVTDRKQLELDLQKKNEEYEIMNNELRSTAKELQAQNEKLWISGNELRWSEEKFSTIFNESPYPVMLIDTDNGCFADVNETMQKTVEYSREELIGKTAAELGIITQETELQTKKLIGEFGHYYDLEVSVTTKSGQLRFGMATGRIIVFNKHAYLIQTIFDITERKRAEEALRESEERLQYAITASNDGLWDWNLETNDIYYSPRWKSILGYEDHEIPNDFSFWEAATEPEDVIKSWELQQKLITKQVDRFVMEFKMRHKQGHWVRILSKAKALFDDGGKAIRIIGTHTDITEQKKMEAALEESQERLRFALEVSGLGEWELDLRTNTIKRNERWAGMLGYSLSEINDSFGQGAELQHPDDRDMVAKAVRDYREGRSDAFKIDYRIRAKDGTYKWIQDCGKTFERDESGQPVRFCGTHADITQQKEKEEKIINLLAEKELLLKEVHHRIKNNMNTVNSLLSLQAGAISEPNAKKALEDAGSRIHSMSLLYDKLYRSADFNEASVKEYLSSLVDDILGNFPNSWKVHIEKRLQDFNLDAKRLQPLGIIINELITNIMKYAFRDRETGLIAVSAANVDGHVSISIQDDGIGMPESVSFYRSTGFGLQLVHALTQQLQGSIRIERGVGTKVVLEFDC